MARGRIRSAQIGSRNQLSKRGPAVSRAMVLQPSTRTYYTWTPAQIRMAEISADSGNLKYAANLCDWLLGDEKIQGALHTRVQALLGLDPSFDKHGDARSSGRVVKTLEKDWWPSYPENELGQIHTWGLLLGVTPGRHQWISPEGYDNRWLPNPEHWHAQHLRYEWTTREWMIRAIRGEQGLAAGEELVLAPGDGEWLLHTPYGNHRPWSMGLWRGLARWALLKSYAISDFARLGESATRNVVENDRDADIDTTKELREELASDISSMGRDGTIVLPSHFSYKLVQIQAGTADIFKKQIELADTAIAIAIRGGNLSSNVEGGSRAAAEVQERLGDKAKLRFDAQSLSTFLHDQSLVWYAEFNFGSKTLAPWPKWPVGEKEDLETKAKTMLEAADAASKWVALGYELDRKAFAEEFEVDGFLKPADGPAPVPVDPNAPPSQDDTDEGEGEGGDGEPVGSTAPSGAGGVAGGEPRAKTGDSGATKARKGRVSSQSEPKLASGAAAKPNSGFISGQLYADALVDAATELGLELVQPSIDMIAKSLEDASDYESLRSALRDGFDGIDHEPLMELTERLLVVAHLNGVAAVNQDV